MRLLVSVILSLVIAVLGVRQIGAQQLPNTPPTGGAQVQGGCCVSENLPPYPTWYAPLNEVTVASPQVKVIWCDDDGDLDGTSRVITLNDVDVTSSFTYATTSTGDCMGDRKESVSTSISLNPGSNTFHAYICDNQSACGGQYYYVYFANPNSPQSPVITLRNHNGENLDRGLCLTTGAGQAAGTSCGDLFVAHSMPAYRTLGRDRALTVMYGSAGAVPRPGVAVVVTQPAGTQTPSSVFADLRVHNGSAYVTRASATYSAFAAGATRQVVLAYDASMDSSGIYAFQVIVSNQYSGEASKADTVTGELFVVNRSSSEFGAGWWIAGLEQLRTGQSSSRVLWLGGDGSAAVYNQLVSNVWQRASGPFRDSLTYSSGEYTRHLRHGVKVVFDANGRHIRTVSRTLHSTYFTWGGSPARLQSIQVPPGGAGTTYTLAYDGSGKLDSILDPSSRVLNATVSSSSLVRLMDADGNYTDFEYDGSKRLTRRLNRRGYGTVYQYANGRRLTRVAIPLQPDASTPRDSARTAIEGWDDGTELAIGVVGSTLTAIDTGVAYTRLDGPRTDVGDSVRFWVDRWGAPTRIVGSVSDTTLLQRIDTSGLVTRLEDPVHAVHRMTYDGRGNLLTQTDSTHEGHGTGGFQQAVLRYTYKSGYTADAPDSIIDPEGLITRLSYNADGLMELAKAPTGQQTRFYFGTGSLAGLPTSTVEYAVPTFTDTTGWSSTTSNVDQTTRFTYNTLGNVDTVVSPMGSRTTYVYNSRTQVERTINAVGDTTRYVLRAMGVPDSIVQIAPTGNRGTAFTYDLNFNRLSITDARGVIRGWQYDAADRDTSEVNEYLLAERRRYGPDGVLDSVYSRDAYWVTRFYDPAGRLTLLRYPARTAGDTALGDSVAMTYDVSGRLTLATNRNGSVARQYYREGTLKQEQQTAVSAVGNGFNVIGRYRYDRSDRRTWYADYGAASGSNDTLLLTYAYQNGMLSKLLIDYPGTGLSNDSALYTWDNLGRRQQVITPHHATVRWFYDQDGRTRRVATTARSCPSFVCATVDSAMINEQYRSYDRANRPLNIVRYIGDIQNSESQAYDAFGQMTYQIQDGSRHDYTYDLSGNRLSNLRWINGVRYGQVSVVDSGHNRLLRDSIVDQGGAYLSANYFYTNNGERRKDEPPSANQRWRQMWFNGLGQMTSIRSYQLYYSQISSPDQTPYQDTISTFSGSIQTNLDSCRYDALGRQIKPCGGLAMSFDGDQVVRVRGTRLIFGPALGDLVAVYDSALGAGSPSRFYAITDGGGHLYSFTTADGASRIGDHFNSVYADRVAFSGALVRGHRFSAAASEAYASEDLTFLRNRYYDQRTGRFLTEDPIGVAGGLNLYGYVGNNPATFTDPFGLSPAGPCKGLMAALCFVVKKIIAGSIAGNILDKAEPVVDGSGTPGSPRAGADQAELMFEGCLQRQRTEGLSGSCSAAVVERLSREATPDQAAGIAQPDKTVTRQEPARGACDQDPKPVTCGRQN